MKIYQNVKIDNIFRNKECEDSRFYNEGKWNNFIKPLLPKDCKDMTFVEFGSNAGLYLRMAKEKGFRNVLGVEKSRMHSNLANQYKKELGINFSVLNKSVDGSFNFDDIPVADVILMSNFHYHLSISDFLIILDRLKSKTRYVVIVSADIINKSRRAKDSLLSISRYFKDWKLVNYIKPISTEDDSCPREMFSLLFESELKRVPIESIFCKNRGRLTVVATDKLANRLAKLVVNNDKINPVDTDYYKELYKKDGKGRGEKAVLKRVNYTINHMYDVKNNGLKNPIIITENNIIFDGGRRFTVLNQQEYKSIIVRIV